MTNEQFREMAKALASILRYSLELDPHQDRKRATLCSPRSQAKLWIRNGGWKNEDRISISGEYPKSSTGYRPSATPARITVAETKPPATIAAELQRRLFPKYLPELTKVTKRVKENDDYISARLANIKALAHVAGAKFHHEPHSSREPSFRFGGDGNYSHQVRPYGKDTLQIQLDNLTFEQAKRVIETVNEETLATNHRQDHADQPAFA